MRVIRVQNSFRYPNHPHPRPLPAYRERGRDIALKFRYNYFMLRLPVLLAEL
jgi:hypothetical protein